ncbi:hypothetical protein KKE28_00825, partial [Patescibacteria group bacterium]|nr:hypothetical protein [Patescibacteria group bacterium]
MSIKEVVLSTYKKVKNFDHTYTPSRWAPLIFALALVGNAGDGLLTLLLHRMGVVEEANQVIASLLHLGTFEYCLVKIIG